MPRGVNVADAATIQGRRLWRPRQLAQAPFAVYDTQEQRIQLATSNTVNSWAPSFGRGPSLIHLTQSCRPFYRLGSFPYMPPTGVTPGGPRVSFDGVDDGLYHRTTSPFWAPGTAWTIYAVVDRAVIAGTSHSGRIIDMGSTGTLDNPGSSWGNAFGVGIAYNHHFAPNPGFAISSGGMDLTSVGAWPESQITLITVVYNAGTVEVWINGTQTHTSSSHTVNLQPCGISFGMECYNDQGWLPVVIREVGLISYPLSLHERVKLEGYALHRWGWPKSLPGTHAYRNAPPLIGA